MFLKRQRLDNREQSGKLGSIFWLVWSLDHQNNQNLQVKLDKCRYRLESHPMQRSVKGTKSHRALLDCNHSNLILRHRLPHTSESNYHPKYQ